MKPIIVLAGLTALNLVACTVTQLAAGDIPLTLGGTLTTLVGATAGVAYGNRPTTVERPDDGNR